MPKQTSHEVEITRFDISVCWRTVAFPFDQSKLFRILPEQGYVLESGIRQALRGQLGGSTEVSGLVANKGALSLTLANTRPGLGITGTVAADVVSEFELLERRLQDHLFFDSRENARFYEVDADVLVWTTHSPIATMRKSLDQNHVLLDTMSESLGHKVGLHGAVVAATDSLPGSEEWHEIHVRPSLRSPEHAFQMVLVFRRREWEPVYKLASRIPAIFEQICEGLS